MQNNSLNTPYVRFEIENGILFVTYKAGLQITQLIARDIVRSRLEFTQQNLYPAIVLDEGVKGIDKDARYYFSSVEGVKCLTAVAMVLDSIYSKFLGTFLIRITQPPIPVKIFVDRQKAVEWLQKFKNDADTYSNKKKVYMF